MQELQNVPVDKLYPHPQNPRLVQREDVIASIESQLREKGSFDPAHALLVRALGDGYQIVMGHHRHEAAKRAGFTTVPCWVRELADDEAFMMLATSNTQDSMSSLEWGMHAYERIELATSQYDNGYGLREYARKLGRDPSAVARNRNAAEVLVHSMQHLKERSGVALMQHLKERSGVALNAQESIDSLKAVLIEKATHLDEVHKCPESTWMLLVTRIVVDNWSVAETKERTADLRDLTIPDKWQNFLPIERAGELILSGKANRSAIDNVVALLESVETTLDNLQVHLEPNSVAMFKEWLAKERSADPLNTSAIRKYQEACKKRVDDIIEAARIAEEERKKAPHAGLKDPGELSGQYDVIYLDPPWSYSNSGFDNSAEANYPTMSIEEIAKLPVPSIAYDGTVMFMWAVNPMLPEALWLLEQWGFEYKTNIAWIKDKGRGFGWWLRSKHELLIIAVKPNAPQPAIRPDSCFEADRGEVHSRKPEKAYEIIEEMYPNSTKIEMFARLTRDGWESWGNQV